MTKVGIIPVANIIEPLSFSKIGVAEWGSGGVRTVEEGSPTAAFNNPALLQADALSAYVELGKRTERDDYFTGIKYDGQFLLPNYGIIVIPLESFTVALSYVNMYDKYQYFGFPVTTVEQPEGTGEFVDAATKEIVHTISISASYSYDNIISFGLTGGLNIITKSDQIYHSSATGSGTGINIIAGLYYRPVESIHIGSTVRYSSTISFATAMDGRDMLIRTDVDSSISGNNPNINAQLASTDYPFDAEFPVAITTGFRFDASDQISLLIETELTKWYNIDSYRYNNTINTHLGCIVRPVESVNLRLGYFTQNDPGKTRPYLLDQQFWTAGVGWNILPDVVLYGSTVQSFYSKTRIMGSLPYSRQLVNQDLFLFGIKYQM